MGNLILTWPKLVGPFKTVSSISYRCVVVQNVILHHFRYRTKKSWSILIFYLCFSKLTRRPNQTCGGSDSESDSDDSDSYLATALARLEEWDERACWCTYVFGVYVYMFLMYVYIIMFPVQVYIIMFLVLVYICCWCGGMYVFDVRLLY